MSGIKNVLYDLEEEKENKENKKFSPTIDAIIDCENTNINIGVSSDSFRRRLTTDYSKSVLFNDDKKIFILNGAPRSGKDTFASIFKSLYKAPVYKTSIIDPIKKLESIINDDDYNRKNKTEDYRKLLCSMKYTLDNYCNYYSFRCISNEINKFINESEEDAVMFIDVRSKKDIDRILLSYPNVETVLLKRAEVSNIEYDNEADKDAMNADESDYDWVINNDYGLDELQEMVKTFIKIIDTKTDSRILHLII